MTWVAVGVGGATLVGGIASNYLGNKSTSATQVPLETLEQAQARQALLGFGQTGTIGDYNAGAAYTGSLGDFAMSSLENEAQNQVTNRLTATDPNMTAASNTLSDLLNTDKYDPLAKGGAYDQLSGGIDRATGVATAAAKRGSAYAGNLYSTNAIQQIGDVQAQGEQTKATTMAGLYQNYINEKIGGISQGASLASTQNGIDEGKIADAYNYGSLPRNLATASDQAQYSEFQRQQQSQAQRVSALSSVSGSNTQFGVPTVTIPQANPWQSVLQLLAQYGGQYAGAKAGSTAGGKTTYTAQGTPVQDQQDMG